MMTVGFFFWRGGELSLSMSHFVRDGKTYLDVPLGGIADHASRLSTICSTSTCDTGTAGIIKLKPVLRRCSGLETTQTLRRSYANNAELSCASVQRSFKLTGLR